MKLLEDRRRMCAVSLNAKGRPRRVVYEDAPRTDAGARGTCWVARLSGGTFVVTRR